MGMMIQLATGLASTPPALLVGSMFLIAGFLFVNRHQAGLSLALLGLMLNLLPIAVNGAMPVSSHAASIARPGLDIDVAHQRHLFAGPGTRLSFLGDVIPVGGKVLSVGDVLLLAGLVRFVTLVGWGLRPQNRSL